MANRIRTGDLHGFNKGRGSKFREGSRVRQTPEEDRKTYRPKCCGNNNKDEDNSPKTLYDKKNRGVIKNTAWKERIKQISAKKMHIQKRRGEKL